jgi:hypothetical protein
LRASSQRQICPHQTPDWSKSILYNSTSWSTRLYSGSLLSGMSLCLSVSLYLCLSPLSIQDLT